MKKTKTGLDGDIEEKEDEVVVEKQKNWKSDDFLQTGCTLYNLAISDNPFGGYPLGRIISTAGESSTGKSFIHLTSLAVAASQKQFDGYTLSYDDAESAFSFDPAHLFGEKFINRVDIKSSDTLEQGYGTIMSLLDSKKPFIHIVDSYDSLTSKEDLAKAEIRRKIDNEEKLTKAEVKLYDGGTYGQEKPKAFAEIYRRCNNELEQTNSLLIVVFQTINDLNPNTRSTTTRRGGKAPTFFSSVESWLTKGKPITKTVNKQTLPIGGNTYVKIKKNRVTGKKREISFPIYEDYGIDDLSNNIDFLVEQGVFVLAKQSIVAGPLGLEKMSKSKLIYYIEEHDLEKDIAELVGNAWNAREDGMRDASRKRRF